jgi:hypothetical protein
VLGVGTVVAPPVGADVAVAEVADGTEVAEVVEVAEPVEPGVDAASSPEHAAARAMTGSASATSQRR